jgi:Domain of unknown function (DUF4332)
VSGETGAADRGAGAAERAARVYLSEIAGGLLVLAGSAVASLRGVEPFATWFYLFAWYATLLVLDGLAAPGGGRHSLLARPAHLATLLCWSAATWLFFELLNLRLQNWYYVFVPADPLARRLGAVLAFATVLPAVFGAEAALERLGLARDTRWPRLRLTRGVLTGLKVAGVLALTLPLLFPVLFFPLVWVALTLLLEPWNWSRDRERSLLGDLERGRPGRLLRLLAAGLLVGLLWELYNAGARSRWIYTVPGFEDWKLFEMPAAGFLGFPPFALECFAVWQALVLAGLAVPREGEPGRPAADPRGLSAAQAPVRVGVPARGLAVFVALVLSAVALAEMERRTISSYAPELADLPGVPGGSLVRAGYDVFSLARADPAEVAAALRSAPAEPEAWIERARLAVLAGIGTQNVRRLLAAGVASVADLAAADPARLSRRLRADGGPEVSDRRLRGWIRAAGRSVDATGRGRP